MCTLAHYYTPCTGSPLYTIQCTFIMYMHTVFKLGSMQLLEPLVHAFEFELKINFVCI